MNRGRYAFARAMEFFPIWFLESTNIYRYRRQIETFLKWIKSDPSIRSFCGYCENAVKVHLRVAIS